MISFARSKKTKHGLLWWKQHSNICCQTLECKLPIYWKAVYQARHPCGCPLHTPHDASQQKGIQYYCSHAQVELAIATSRDIGVHARFCPCLLSLLHSDDDLLAAYSARQESVMILQDMSRRPVILRQASGSPNSRSCKASWRPW